MAVRGMAENMDRARLLGIPVNQLSLLLWSTAGGLAALTVVLRAPSEGVQPTAAAGPTVLLPALAAAVVVGMRSPGAFSPACCSACSTSWCCGTSIERRHPGGAAGGHRRGAAGAAALGALLDEGESSWSVVGVATGCSPMPRSARRTARMVLWAVVIVAVLALPVVGTDSQVNFGTTAYALVALSMVVLYGLGWRGQPRPGGGHGRRGGDHRQPHRRPQRRPVRLARPRGPGRRAHRPGARPARCGCPASSWPSRPWPFAVAMQLYFLNPANYESCCRPPTSGPSRGALELSDERYGRAGPGAGRGRRVHRAQPQGGARRSLDLGHPRQLAGAAAGINTVETRLAVLIFAGMLAGVGRRPARGGAAGHRPSTYPASTSLLVFSMAVIGVSSLGGTLAGVVGAVDWLPVPDAQLLLTGVGLLAILLVMPGGLAQAFERLRDRFVHAVATRRGMVEFDTVETVEQAVEPGHLASIRRDAGAGLMVGSARREAGHPPAHLRGRRGLVRSLQVLFGIDMGVERNELLAPLGTNGAASRPC